jgi:RNA recognition motif-containing protein
MSSDYYGASSPAATAAAGGGAKPTFPSSAVQQIPTFSSIPGSSLAHSDHSKIFVGGLSWQTNEESLRWHFEQYGPVISVEVMRDRNTGGAFVCGSVFLLIHKICV